MKKPTIEKVEADVGMGHAAPDDAASPTTQLSVPAPVAVSDAEVDAAIVNSGMQLPIPASRQHFRKALEGFAATRTQPVLEPNLDTARLDWLETQSTSYGFEDMHEGNRWTIEGPFMSLRTAIDEGIAANKKEPS